MLFLWKKNVNTGIKGLIPFSKYAKIVEHKYNDRHSRNNTRSELRVANKIYTKIESYIQYYYLVHVILMISINMFIYYYIKLFEMLEVCIHKISVIVILKLANTVASRPS